MPPGALLFYFFGPCLSLWCLTQKGQASVSELGILLARPAFRERRGSFGAWDFFECHTRHSKKFPSIPSRPEIKERAPSLWDEAHSFGGSAGDRTQDQRLKRPLLYRLSYRPRRRTRWPSDDGNRKCRLFQEPTQETSSKLSIRRETTFFPAAEYSFSEIPYASGISNSKSLNRARSASFISSQSTSS